MARPVVLVTGLGGLIGRAFLRCRVTPTELARPRRLYGCSTLWGEMSGCSQRDAARGIARAIDAPASVRSDICFVTSDNRWGDRDLAHSREVLGYVPQDHAEDHR